MFRALSQQPGISLKVSYLEEAAPDSPWPKESLAPFESVLSGMTFGRGRVRCHTNWRLPKFSESDVVMVNAAVTGLTTQLVMRQCINQRVPFVFWGEILRTRTGFPGIAQRSLAAPLGSASAIAAIGSTAQADYKRRYPGTPVFELPYYCDISAFRDARRFRNDTAPVRFLYCGQMIERKGFDVLLEAFSYLVESGFDIRLSIAGRSTHFGNTRIAGLSPEVRERLEFSGFVSPADLPVLFSEADVFVLPSRHDGWGVVINQAIGAGLPVIASSAVGAATDLVDEGVNGLVVPPGELNPLKEAMIKLALDRALRSSMSAQAESISAQLAPQVGASRLAGILGAATIKTSLPTPTVPCLTFNQ